MRFDKQIGALRQSRLIKTAIQAIGGGEPQHTTLVEIPAEVVVDEKILAQHQFQRLFPFADQAVKTIAGREGDDKRGVDFKARGQMPNLLTKVWDTVNVEGAVPAFDMGACEIKGRPTLLIDEDGVAVLHFKFRAWLTCDQLGRLGPYTNAEIHWTGEPVQGDLTSPGVGGDVAKGAALIQANAKKKNKGGLALVPDDVAPHTEDDGKVFSLNPQAQALFKEAKRAGRITDDEAVLRSARQVARLSASTKAKKITITAEDLQEALAANTTPDPASATTH